MNRQAPQKRCIRAGQHLTPMGDYRWPPCHQSLETITCRINYHVNSLRITVSIPGLYSIPAKAPGVDATITSAERRMKFMLNSQLLYYEWNQSLGNRI